MRETFNETTDLYLQLLRKAQEVEDPRLVGMILDRLQQGPPHLMATESGCVVIPFPMNVIRPESCTDEARFWPRGAAAQVGHLMAFYALPVVAHSFIG
ncbi:MAG: hypothetical protein GY697_08010 [Desulfobacterales bacterium]|nr:hypothetical protein [Desulfobacterales bacterium]